MSIDKAVNDVRNMLIQGMEQSKDIIFNGLLNNVNVSIPESLFVQHFLPCFLNRSDNKNWVIEWIGISGSPMAEVNVLDDKTKQLLFIVPGLLNSNNVFLTKQNGDLGDIFTRYDQINSNIPTAGLNFLSQALNSKSDELSSKVDFKDVNNRWYSILTRYGLIADKNTSNSNPDDNSLSDMLDF